MKLSTLTLLRAKTVLMASGLMIVLAAGAGVAPGFAESTASWWHVNVGSRPTALSPGGKGTVVISATNLGDADMDGEGAPVTLTDTLPVGVVAKEAWYAAGTNGVDNRPEGEPERCSVSVTVVSTVVCSFRGILPPYTRLEVSIKVEMEEGLPAGALADEVDVSGGEAPGVSVSDPLAVGAATPFGVETFESSPESANGSLETQAGSHPFQWTTTVVLSAGAETKGHEGYIGEVVQPALPKDLKFDLPPGLVGNPSPFPQCTEGLFKLKNCPPESQLGVAVVTLANPLKRTISMPVFNMVPARGEPARLGFNAGGNAVFLDTAIRTGDDYGVTVSANNITQTAAFLSSQVTIWGWPGDPRHDDSRGYACLEDSFSATRACPENAVNAPFLSLPTLCGKDSSSEPFEVSMEGDSWPAPGKPAESTEPKQLEYKLHDPTGPSVALDGCNKLSFEPSIKVASDDAVAGAPTGLTVDVHVPQQEVLIPNGLAESDVKNISVTLPEGVALNPAGANGLEACSESEIGFTGVRSASGTDLFTSGLPAPAGTPTEPFCPDASKIGIVKIKTPLLPNELEGAVYLAAQEENPFTSLIAIYLVAEDPVSGTLVKLPGEVSLTPSGQIAATFKNNPQLPFEDAELHFFGGEKAPLATPRHCGTYTTEASFTPWSAGDESVPSSSSFAISSCPVGTSLPFSPSLTGGTENIQAGGFTPFTITMSREDGNQQLQGIQLHMPPGLLGMLSSVTPCEEAQANAGACGEASLIGETTVSVGLGGDPYTVTGGKVYITRPYHGAPYGLAIEEPAKAGPFDLEHTKEHHPACDCLVVRAKIGVDPLTSALTVTANSGAEEDSIPTILEGIPLQIKHVNVTVNRGGFTFNPTDCDPLKITGSLSSAEGATSSLSVPFQITDCAALAFKPTFAASTAAHNTRTGGASLTTTVTYPRTPQGTEADIAKVKVSLPAKLPARLSTLQKACTEQTFAANPANCPAASRIGEATTDTPVLPTPLSGPAYFVSHGGAKYPELVIVLQGDNVTIDLHGETAISKKGVLTSTFGAVPDAPFSSFELKLPEGRYSALTANGADLCKAGSLTMPTELVAQDGAVIDQSTRVKITGCPKKAKHVAKRKSGKHRK